MYNLFGIGIIIKGKSLIEEILYTAVYLGDYQIKNMPAIEWDRFHVHVLTLYKCCIVILNFQSNQIETQGNCAAPRKTQNSISH